MEWITCLNQAIRYIEEHLTEEIDYECLGKAACCSAYHFQRMFAYMAEVPLSEYIRRRRMSLAAADLKCTDEKVVELALKYGYQSPTAFNRAFQSVHGVTPSAARKAGVPVKSYPPISFKLMIKGVEEMNYRLEQKEAFRIVGVRQRLKERLEENFEIVPKMWETVAKDGTVPSLTALMDRELKGVLGKSASARNLEKLELYDRGTKRPETNRRNGRGRDPGQNLGEFFAEKGSALRLFKSWNGESIRNGCLLRGMSMTGDRM